MLVAGPGDQLARDIEIRRILGAIKPAEEQAVGLPFGLEVFPPSGIGEAAVQRQRPAVAVHRSFLAKTRFLITGGWEMKSLNCWTSEGVELAPLSGLACG